MRWLILLLFLSACISSGPDEICEIGNAYYCHPNTGELYPAVLRCQNATLQSALIEAGWYECGEEIRDRLLQGRELINILSSTTKQGTTYISIHNPQDTDQTFTLRPSCERGDIETYAKRTIEPKSTDIIPLVINAPPGHHTCIINITSKDLSAQKPITVQGP